jgi:hypothetical protein
MTLALQRNDTAASSAAVVLLLWEPAGRTKYNADGATTPAALAGCICKCIAGGCNDAGVAAQ